MIKKIAVLLCFVLLLQGCASSEVSRGAAAQFNAAYQNGGYAFAGDGHPGQSWQDSTQTTKGVLIGGATGAVTGGMTTGVGVWPGAAGGAIIGGAIGAYIDSKTTLQDKLINRGIKVIVLGDQVLIVLPSRDTFNGMTAQINSSAYSSLNLVAQLINTYYVNMSIKIAAYTNASGCKPFDESLTVQQANNIEKYLWNRVNTRMLYAEGDGDSRPIAPLGSRENDRVEISLEKLPA